MQQHIFTANEKLSDIIIANPMLLQILDRCGIRFGFGEKSIRAVCDEYMVDVDFFLLICNVYTFTDYIPSPDYISTINMSAMLNYLKLSHNHYLMKRVPHIEQYIKRIAKIMPDNVSQLILHFFKQFKTGMTKHFSYEECVIFPHVQHLLEGRNDATKYTSSNNEHTNIEDQLNDLAQIVVKYLPAAQTTNDIIDVVMDILEFSTDIKRHQVIEDKILMPLVKQLEKTVR